MESGNVNFELAGLALDKAEGSRFEKFVNSYFPSLLGTGFVPLGGTHDGGADALQENGLWEDSEKPTVFYQASIERNHRDKIRRTVNRLNEFGRKVESIIYLTSQSIPRFDEEEDFLREKHGIRIKIRDKGYIVAHINDTQGTRAAYFTHLAPTLDYLKHLGSTQDIFVPSIAVSSPTVYVFLRQELERQSSRKESLVNAIADGLIIWALEGTDPDKNIFMTPREIMQKIAETVPAAPNLIKPVFDARLSILRGRKQSIRWYRRQDKYCLAYEIRRRVEKDNIKDEVIHSEVRDGFITKLSRFNTTLSPEEIQEAADISLQILQKLFEKQGLEFAAFVRGEFSNSNPMSTITDILEETVDNGSKGDRWVFLKEAILNNLQQAFYASTEKERLFLHSLSATYTLLFCLKTDPRIVEYFQNMAADFYLYVGSDLIVRAFSERYLHPADQITRNTLKIIKQAGGILVLTEPVLDEVVHNLIGANFEFINHYSSVEHNINLDIARQSSKILIRSYFYGKLSPPEGIPPPRSWENFIGQFCDYTDLQRPSGKESIKLYLQAEFNFIYEDKADLKKITSEDEITELAKRIEPEKKNYTIAENDALLTLAVYGRRRKRGEHSRISEFGYRTWWLTGERVIMAHTRELVKSNRSRYIMNPDFLVKFLTLAPSAADVRKTYKSVFPSLLGLRLARRVSERELREVLAKVKEADELDEGRKFATISQLSDRLKSSFLREKASSEDEDRTPVYK